ncbi:MAG: ester cyclase [Verrucomicrobiota bacterium]
MSVDERKVMSRRALEMWGSDCADPGDDLFGEGYVNHQEPDAAGGISDKSLEEWRELVGGFRESFSEATVQILRQVAEGDLVATHWEISATQSGEFLGRGATGKRTTWTGVQIDRFEGGKIAESWVPWDKYRFLEGLGFVD